MSVDFRDRYESNKKLSHARKLFERPPKLKDEWGRPVYFRSPSKIWGRLVGVTPLSIPPCRPDIIRGISVLAPSAIVGSRY